MNTDHIHKMQNQFDELARQHPDEPKIEFWFARDLQEPLGYVRWENFLTAIQRAIESCKSNICALAKSRDKEIILSMDWSQCQAIEKDGSKLSGAWVFRGTRIPVQALFENLDEGATVDDFLAWFPGVSRGQVDEVLMFASSSLATA